MNNNLLMSASIKWNNNVKLILSDVDETIADVYTPASADMILSINKLLSRGIKLFMVSGGGLKSINERVALRVDSKLRKNILIAHCSGAEVWGFDDAGELNPNPYYSLYDEKVTDSQKIKWREIVNTAVEKFKLTKFETMPVKEFQNITGNDPFSIMFADRGPQITLEFPNSYKLDDGQLRVVGNTLGITIPEHEGTHDLRVPIINYLNSEYLRHNLPVNSKLAGVFALDNPIQGIDKTYAIKFVLENKSLLKKLDLPENIEKMSSSIEIWGDKFVQKKGGTDFQMCKAVEMRVRTIDFREEDINEFPPGYNIQIWDGENTLHEGLLEFLKLSGFIDV